jgi:hypothetical protein
MLSVSLIQEIDSPEQSLLFYRVTVTPDLIIHHAHHWPPAELAASNALKPAPVPGNRLA